ncbi:MAG: ankyrin repeat domain-containing protein [Deltaproteobacteria bacterium]|nr:ankyrin repeat domain-containing protein [Deltaproteobacteria bacterium]
MSDEDFVQLCGKGTAATIEKNLKAGANPNAKADPDGRGKMSALMRAAKHNNIPGMQALLKAGADVNARNGEGETALMLALNWTADTNLPAIQTLLAAGANVNAHMQDGWTALMAASMDSRETVVQALLAAGADPKAQRADGDTALMLAAEYNRHGETIRALLAAGSEVNARNGEGKTALMRAAAYNNLDVVHMLLDAGADKSLEDNDGHNALWHAQESVRAGYRSEGQEEGPKIVRLLQDSAQR